MARAIEPPTAASAQPPGPAASSVPFATSLIMATRVIVEMSPSTRTASRPWVSMISVDGMALGGRSPAKASRVLPSGS